MEEQSCITIRNGTYPIHSSEYLDYTRPIFPQEPVAQLKRSWSNMRNRSGKVTWDTVELTEHGAAIMQEYLAGGYCNFTVSYTSDSHLQASSKRSRPRNTRIQKVQANRKALDLSLDGKCCSLKTRKASLALRKAEQRWYRDMSAQQPLASDYERISPRVQRKRARYARRFYRSFGPLENDANYLDLGEYLPMFSFDEYLMRVAHPTPISPAEIGNLYNGNN